MDAYDEGPGARREPGGLDDPAPPLPEGAANDIPGDPPRAGAAGLPDRTGPAPDAPAPSGPLPVPAAQQPEPAPRTGIAALSLPYQIAAALVLAVVAVVACVHLGMVFLHVAPANTVTKEHGKAIDDWIYPEFEQNWKLFAPNPLQQNFDVQVRAEMLAGDGGERTTGWYDLSALDGAAIAGNPLPSHTQQNELRRAWDFYVASHDGENRPQGLRGALSEGYLRRVVVLRLGREHPARHGETVQRVQVRSRTTNVPSPRWSHEQVPTTPVYRQLPWWSLPEGEWAGAGA
ncbi:DUF5819 family protein [Streptomyces colonosanans]|uniref:Uncharacterized protein n=1 Tax=Streptomyces colonosanans TaxID=1428652 RepID=A0A1S2PE76_9ACTN|nr:DUF5819 family protein [Streptomyces colonosanans]OIJ91906.1 hypothetical protein BIV24_14110 [Streptomyces colonosanans]